QNIMPGIQLLIFGGEHDAVQLCAFAAMSGWEVTVVTSPSDPKTLDNFPGADQVTALAAESLHTLAMDSQTAVILMTHNFANDLKYITALKDVKLAYLGLLGPAKRREKLLSQLMEQHPELHSDFPDAIYGPAGINIGAETPQEIAVSIIAEILSVMRRQQPMPLREKKTGIHT
ncbi:MAG: XdhC family protein, partial [Bacteroidota bacterium]